MSTIVWPLVGRSDELDRAYRALAGQATGGLVIAGPSGVGKTRLASECLTMTGQLGFATARARASDSAATIPLGALSPLLPPLDDVRSPQELLRRARSAIAGRRDGAGLALLVDDAHRLDDMSATVVSQLASEREAFVILTVRSNEPAPDSILALWKDGIAERLDVRPLARTAVDELLQAVLGDRVDGGTVRRFAEASGGNPLYLRELVLAARECDALVQENRIWRLSKPLPVSSRLVEILGQRLAGVGQAEEDLLEIVAFGEPLGFGILERHFGVAALEALEMSGLIRVEHDGRRVEVMLAHPLYGEVVRGRLPVARAREVHRRLARLLSGTGARRRDDALRLGTSELEAGGPLDAGVLLAAAEAARARWDLALAQRLAHGAAGAGGGFPANLLLAQLHLLQGRPDEAEHALAALVDMASTDAERVVLAATRIDNFAVALGRRDEAIRVAIETEAQLTDIEARHELAGKRAELLHLAGQPEPALEVLAPLLRQGNRTVALAAPVASICLVLCGRFSEAISVTEQGLAAHLAHRGHPLTFGPHTFLVVRGVALGHAGRLLEATALAEAGYARAVDDDSVEAHGMYAELLAWLHLLAGRPASAHHFAAEAAGLYRQLGWLPFLRFALAHLAHASALLRDSKEAEQAVADLGDLGISESDVAGSLILQSRAWVSISAGDLGTGQELLERAAGLAARTHDRAGESAALHDLARIGQAAAVAGRLRSLASAMEGELVQVRARYATAQAALDAPRLEAAAADFGRMGFTLAAAESMAGAAVALHRAGRARAAADVERRVAAFLQSCEGAVTPAVADVTAQATLTPQELKVAGLAAAGMANKDIARHLGVSVRTVETQLQRVYQKLGVHRRADLPDALVL